MRQDELIFSVHGLFTLPELELPPGVTAGPPQRERLRTSYFDTADLRLARTGIVLAQRSAGDGEQWQLELPAELAGAGIVEFTTGGPDARPAEFTAGGPAAGPPD